MAWVSIVSLLDELTWETYLFLKLEIRKSNKMEET